MENGNVVSIEDRIPKLKQQRRKKANRRLILLLLLFFILIALILYIQSPLSYVKYVVINGNHLHSDSEILATAQISEETNIWRVRSKEIEKSLTSLPEMRDAHVETKLPNSVIISVKEYKRISYISKGKNYLPVIENGQILHEKKTTDLPLNAPILFGFSENKALKEMINSLEELPTEVMNSISEIHYEPTEADAFHISLYMNDGNEVSATIRTFAKKMSHYPSIISQLDPHQKGIINLEVGSYFKAYQSEGADLDETEKDSEG